MMKNADKLKRERFVFTCEEMRKIANGIEKKMFEKLDLSYIRARKL